MEDRKLLIAGIDPGMTTGFAILDIDGNILHLESSKNMDLKSPGGKKTDKFLLTSWWKPARIKMPW